MKFLRIANPFIIFILLIVFLAPLGCAEKKTGSGGGDDASDDDTAADDDTAGESGLNAYAVRLNTVSVSLAGAAVAAANFYDADGTQQNGVTMKIDDWIASVEAFASDAPDFDYQFIPRLEGASVGPIAYAELANAVFYEDAQASRLCLGWLEEGHDDDGLCGLEDGWVVTHPHEGAFELTSLEEVNRRDGDQPAHLGELVNLQDVIHTGSGTIVSGDYLKTYVMRDGWGAKIFADAAATVADQGYDGSLVPQIETFPGDEIFVIARVTVHDNMIEIVPKSPYHLAVLSTRNEIESPTLLTVDELKSEPYRYAGALVRLDDMQIVDVDPDDPATDWPAYGTKSKDILAAHASGGSRIVMPVYENTGLPGSTKPTSGFDFVGVAEVDGDTKLVFPRRVEDINPSDEPLEGHIRVSIVDEDKAAPVDLSDLNAGMQPLGEDGALVPVVSLAETALAAGLTRNPKLFEFKPVAYDDRQPFETLVYNEMKSGVFYAGQRTDEDQPDPMVNSHFWPDMGLSEIYYLNGVDRIQAFRPTDPPTEGEAEYGEGITLRINGKSYAIPFSSMARTTYDGQEAVATASLISDVVLSQYTMSGSFTADQIKFLYDYRFVARDESDEATVRFADLDGGYLVLADDPYVVFPDLGASYRVDEILVVDMMRYIQVNDGVNDPVIVYLRDCETESADVGDGVFEDVVFFRTVLESSGMNTDEGMYRHDFLLVATDDFISDWTYRHGHLDSMYFRPYENRGYTTDPAVGAYGGRVSTKAVYEIRLRDVPQSAPSIPISDINGAPLDEIIYGSDANTCTGCHWKDEGLQIPVDCASCHTVPELR